MMDEAIATESESPPWNPAPPSPHAPHESEDSPIQSVKRELQEELEKCATQDSVGETIFSRSWLLSLLVKAVDYVQSGTKNEEDDSIDNQHSIDRPPSPRPGPSLGTDGPSTAEQSTLATNQEGTASTPTSASKREGEDCGVSGDVSVNRQQGGHACDGSGEGGVALLPSNGGPRPHELDEDIENDMCKLWDTSVNKDVAKFLVDNQSVPLLLGVAQRTTAPRLTEICLGIIGNLACHEQLSQESLMTENNIHEVFEFLHDEDTQVVYECLRLMQTCLGHPSAGAHWIGCIVARESTVRLRLQFILQSSTVVDLLAQAGTLIDLLFASNEELAVLWSTEEFLQSLVEAVNQLRLSSSEPQHVAPYMYVLNVLSSLEEGAAILVALRCDVEDILVWFVVEASCEVALEGEGPSHLLAACSVLHYLHQSTTGGEVTGGFRKDAPSDLLPSLERLQQALLQEEEDDSSVSHGESKEVGSNKDSAGEDGRPSSTLKQLRTVVNSLLELQQQPIEAS